MVKEKNKKLFSKKELTIINDSDFLKNKIIINKKINTLLSNSEAKLKHFVTGKKGSFPEDLLVSAGKISKGERYLDLPFQVLDYPRHFSRESIFTYRTMFWWGNFFSCTLHLQGNMLQQFRELLLLNCSKIARRKIYFCVNDNPWEYHFEPSNYVPLIEIPSKELAHLLRTKPFLKFSRKLPLEHHDQLPAFALETFEWFYELLYK